MMNTWSAVPVIAAGTADPAAVTPSTERPAVVANEIVIDVADPDVPSAPAALTNCVMLDHCAEKFDASSLLRICPVLPPVGSAPNDADMIAEIGNPSVVATPATVIDAGT